MYYRGYSAKGTNFIDSTSVAETISNKISSGTQPKNKAIFSNAKQVMGNNFPSVWTNIANNQNTTTTINTSSNYNSYSYQNCTDNSYTAHIYKWIPGRTFINNQYDINMSQYKAAWRVTKHQGVPFTQFTYNKDTQND